MRIQYSLSNYRCFPDTSAVSIVIEPGFTSFIGLNNAGKSTILRSLYELRDLFIGLSSQSPQWTSGSEELNQSLGLPIHDVADPDEIFTDGCDRDLQIEVGIEETTARSGVQMPRRVRVTVDRVRKTYAVDLSLTGESFVRTGSWQMHGNTPVLRLPSNEMWDVTPFFEVFRTLASTLYLGALSTAIGFSPSAAIFSPH